MTAQLEETCQDLAAWIPAAAALIAEPDIQPLHGTRTAPGSVPPWNQGAANAFYDLYAAARHIEAQLRMAVSGSVRHRGGSDVVTLLVLETIPKLAAGTDSALSDAAARELSYLLTRVLQLPAIDLEDRPVRIPAPCPYCRRPMLRFYPRDRKLTCLAYGACFDADDRHPVGEMQASSISGEQFIAWADGSIQFPEGL